MSLALDQAKIALNENEVPVGCVIVKDNKVISSSYNQVESKNNSLQHAEIISLHKAQEKLDYKHLYDCDIYITLEPCPMCAGAIVLSRCKRIIYGAKDPKSGAIESLFNIGNNKKLNHQCEIISGVMEEECSDILKEFFKNLRNKNG